MNYVGSTDSMEFDFGYKISSWDMDEDLRPGNTSFMLCMDGF